jgi:hypothetical protein
MSRQEWWRALFACIDAKQTRQFLTYLSPDALFRYGSAPPAIGHAAIGGVVDLFFESMGSSSHSIGRTWEEPGCAICQGEVTYVLTDGSQVTLPFCNVLSLAGEKISRYEIYIDPTPLMPAVAS